MICYQLLQQIIFYVLRHLLGTSFLLRKNKRVNKCHTISPSEQHIYLICDIVLRTNQWQILLNSLLFLPSSTLSLNQISLISRIFFYFDFNHKLLKKWRSFQACTSHLSPIGRRIKTIWNTLRSKSENRCSLKITW